MWDLLLLAVGCLGACVLNCALVSLNSVVGRCLLAWFLLRAGWLLVIVSLLRCFCLDFCGGLVFGFWRLCFVCWFLVCGVAQVCLCGWFCSA